MQIQRAFPRYRNYPQLLARNYRTRVFREIFPRRRPALSVSYREATRRRALG